MRNCRLIQWLLLIVLFVSGSADAQNPPASAVPGVPWPAVDALGRKLPTPEEAGPPRSDRFVGIFYFLWLNERHNSSPNWEGPYDVARILQADPDAIHKPDSPLWGRIGTSHYWGEPLYGYYLATDPWVLRRHVARTEHRRVELESDGESAVPGAGPRVSRGDPALGSRPAGEHEPSDHPVQVG